MATEDLYGLSTEVERRAKVECVEISIEIAKRMLDAQGRAPGDVDMDDTDIVVRYGELNDSGALTILGTLAPKLATRMRKEFDEAYIRLSGSV